MKVRVSDLSDKGLSVNETLPLDALNQRMSEDSSNDIIFTEAPKVSLHLSRILGGVCISGAISSAYTQPCSRCFDQLPRSVELRIEHLLKERAPGGNMLEEDDVGVTYYEGDVVDLDNLIQETLILSLDSVYHPPCDKSDRCSVCGKAPQPSLAHSPDINGKATLGQLIQAAQKSQKLTKR